MALFHRFQGFGRRPSQFMRVRSFVNSVNFVSRLDCLNLIPKRGRDEILFLLHWNLNNPIVYDSTTKHLTVFSLCSAVWQKWPLRVLTTLIAPFLLGSGLVTVCGNRLFLIQLPLYLSFRKLSGYSNGYSDPIMVCQRVRINNLIIPDGCT